MVIIEMNPRVSRSSALASKVGPKGGNEEKGAAMGFNGKVLRRREACSLRCWWWCSGGDVELTASWEDVSVVGAQGNKRLPAGAQESALPDSDRNTGYQEGVSRQSAGGTACQAVQFAAVVASTHTLTATWYGQGSAPGRYLTGNPNVRVPSLVHRPPASPSPRWLPSWLWATPWTR